MPRRGGDPVLGDDQVFGADDDDVVAGVDRDAGADPAGGHRVVAFVVAHECLDADGAGGAGGDLIGVEAGARGERLCEQTVAGARLRRAV